MDNAQYNNFFRILSKIVHADLPTVEDKKKAFLASIESKAEDYYVEIDKANLDEFLSWFGGDLGDVDDLLISKKADA